MLSILIPTATAAWGTIMMTESVREYRRSARRAAVRWEQRARLAR
jgi:hypothetical protein